MGKNKNRKTKQAAAKQRLVTMEDLRALSDDSSSSLPPEEDWDADAQALKKSIEEGAFDAVIQAYQRHGKDDDSVEEAELDGHDEEEVEEEHLEGNDVAEADPEAVGDSSDSESEDSQGHDNDDHVEGDHSEDEPDSKPKAVSSAGAEEEHSNDDSEQEEEEDDDDDSDSDSASHSPEETKPEDMNTRALRVVTEDLVAARADMPWAETFTIVPPSTSPFAPGVEDPLDVHDDLKREVAFYDIALEATLLARKKCEEAKIPFSRPDDFFAEMVKTDEHMARIKDRLIFENKKMEAVAQRKAQKEQKLRAKEAQSNRLAEKAKRQKEHYKAVQEWAANHRADNDSSFVPPRPSKKRQAADRKYGFGGKRGRFKKTDPATLNDMSGFNKRGNFEGGRKSSGGGAAAAKKRPGKRARQASRSNR